MKQQTRPTRPILLTALSLATAAMLSACGGGGGGDSGGGSSGTPIDPTQLKGRWTTPSGTTPATTAVVLPDSSSGTKATAWVLEQDRSNLLKLTVSNDSSVSGKSYAIGKGDATGAAVTGKITTNLSATPKRISFSGVVTTERPFDLSDALTSAAAQGDVAGAWRATSGSNAVVTSWTVATDGGVSGSSTTGCTYTGKVAAIASTAAYNADFDESCSDGSKTSFKGIATVNPQKSSLTVTATTADGAKGVAVFFAK